MLPAERHQKMVELINQRGSMRVSELSQIFEVTEETIRRDLDKLEAEGKIRRSHGGAVRIYDEAPEISYLEREGTQVQEKRKIAKEAQKLVQPGDRIILDASSTAWYLATILPDVPLTVLTNSARVAIELAGRERVEVILIGGILRPRSLSFVGPMAERFLEYYHVNKAFLSCKAVHPEHGVTEGNELQALVKRKMIEIADEVYILADHSKFGLRDFTHLVDLARVTAIITDDAADAEVCRELKARGVKVIQASG
ncbi:DeoR/GlpR family DNA-binding transcription regulator [Alicyclobacillus cellulosilyticus]|uniref:DeoR/GlpR family DNA-binding transcription regulator n=1 Tax=Alicyclobacillus cellulosilyticus TaxID=1003997 RepID=UPI001663988B|nr:DeoR/GlpR family DNA-binding transcription regulator [Alicyclobacillus cellulosilyticus]